MPQQYTIWCPVSVRDDFDDYISHLATQSDRQRVNEAFEAFHELFALNPGVRPPIQYSAAPAVPKTAVEMELKQLGIRFFFHIEFSDRFVWLHGITV